MPIYQWQQPAVQRLIHIAGHSFVVLVQNNLAAEHFSQQYKGSILQKTHPPAGYSHIAFPGTEHKQQPEDLKKGSNEPPTLLHKKQRRELCHLIISPRCGQIHISAVKSGVDFFTLLNPPAYQA